MPTRHGGRYVPTHSKEINMHAARIMWVPFFLLMHGCSVRHLTEGMEGLCDGTGLKIAAPTEGVYLGAYDWLENGKPGVKEFEDAVGAKVALTSGGVCVSREGQPFSINAACLKRLNEKGYVVLIDVVPRSYSPQEILHGRADYMLRQVAETISRANVPVMLAYPREPELQPRIGFDGGGYGPDGDKVRQEVDDTYSAYGRTDQNDPMSLDGPERYRDMCRHIHDVIETKAPGIATWVVGAAVLFWPGQTTRDHYTLFYPGDAYVDWHALDVYPAVAGESDAPAPTRKWADVVEALWAEIIATNPDKPVMLTEFGVHSQWGGRDTWFKDFFAEVRTNPKYRNLKGFIYWQMGTDAFDGSNCRIRTTDPEAATWKTEIGDHPGFWHSDMRTIGGTMVTGFGGGL